MISSKRIDKAIAILAGLALAFTIAFMFFPEDAGIVGASSQPGYVSLFDKGGVMSVDIAVNEDDFAQMLDNAVAEEYIMCDLTVNGDVYRSVGIRPKGNSSLTQVASSASDRYSFKFDLDRYVSGQSLMGLDKFVVNNMQSDPTYMKEFLSYELMDYIGVETPLFCFAFITVNGEPWGLYLAVEAIDESFARRVYGSGHGELYKPEGMEMGAGAPSMGEAPGKAGGMGMELSEAALNALLEAFSDAGVSGEAVSALERGDVREAFRSLSEEELKSVFSALEEGEVISGEELLALELMISKGASQAPPGGADGFTPDGGLLATYPDMREGNGLPPGDGARGGAGKTGGGADLIYVDDEISSYPDIFEDPVLKAGEADMKRVIAAIKGLNKGEDLPGYVDTSAALKYFAANTALVNLDSYVSSFKHNYYLYEDNGVLTILPWDFNLSFGAFQLGSASAAVNFPIDTPVSGTTLEERPLLGRLLEKSGYLEEYHGYLLDIAQNYFLSGCFEERIDELNGLIGAYVKQDATAFYTYGEYSGAIEQLKLFGGLRAKSMMGQLDGSIPSTQEGQSADEGSLIDASLLDMNALGAQGREMGAGREKTAFNRNR